MPPEKTEALLVTDRKSFQYPKIVLGGHEIEREKSIKYLGVQLNQSLSFGEHLQIATAKAIQCAAALSWRMPNIGGPREAKRRLVVKVANLKLLYTVPVWTSAHNNHAIQKNLFSAQRGVVLRTVSALLLNQLARNRSCNGGYPQGWKAQTRREMAEEMAW